MAKRRRNQRVSKYSSQRFSRMVWVVGGISILVIAVVIGIFVMNDKPDIGEAFVDDGNRHLEEEPSDYIWRTSPPTSGPHAPNIASWGIYEESVPNWSQVHNLEDGGVILHYNCPEGCPGIVSELKDIVDEVGRDRLIMHPYENMGSRIALTAWTRMLTLDEVDHDQIVAFIEAYRGIDHH